ncbi:hypothetical protein [Emticicia fluvialis]|uniref:hypothetical protein n=1 Tax=Emticicia fluvialis TaxID=2974474 RepID=UPI0021654906|nr:hypothetical protein [Emticicia fluvialis]
MEKVIPTRPPADRLLNNLPTTTQLLSRELTGSYAEFREREYRPLQDELFKAIFPVLGRHANSARLSPVMQQAFVQELADRLTSEYFSKAFDYLKKQQKQEAAETARKLQEQKEARTAAMRNISATDFKGRILANLDALVAARNPGRKFRLDNYCVKAFELCLGYFHAGGASAMNKNKGICLLGKVGTGKSTLMAAFQDNPLASFRGIKAQEIVESYVINPEQTIDEILAEKPLGGDENCYGFTRYDLLIEEVGREQLSVNVRGESYKTTPVNVMEKVLLELYDRPGVRVHLISNAETPEKLAALYGEAAASRIYDMFNVITFDPKAPNRRYGG